MEDQWHHQSWQKKINWANGSDKEMKVRDEMKETGMCN